MLEVKNGYKSFGPDAHALKGVSFEIKSGEVVAIMGRSGSGKSTLLNCIAGIESLDEGEIYFDGAPLRFKDESFMSSFRAKSMGIVFQQFNLLSRARVAEQLRFTTDADEQSIEETLKKLELSELSNKVIEECSGGQQQRVAIARAVVKKPKLILADEPTANLDAELALKSLKMMVDLSKEQNSAVLIVTHDDRITPLCDRVLKLECGLISGGAA